MVKTKPISSQHKFSLFVRYTFRTNASSVSPRNVSAIEHLLRKGKKQLELYEEPSVKDCWVSEEMKRWDESSKMRLPGDTKDTSGTWWLHLGVFARSLASRPRPCAAILTQGTSINVPQSHHNRIYAKFYMVDSQWKTCFTTILQILHFYTPSKTPQSTQRPIRQQSIRAGRCPRGTSY